MLMNLIIFVDNTIISRIHDISNINSIFMSYSANIFIHRAPRSSAPGAAGASASAPAIGVPTKLPPTNITYFLLLRSSRQTRPERWQGGGASGEVHVLCALFGSSRRTMDWLRLRSGTEEGEEEGDAKREEQGIKQERASDITL